jgi:hypothetical protein
MIGKLTVKLEDGVSLRNPVVREHVILELENDQRATAYVPNDLGDWCGSLDLCHVLDIDNNKIVLSGIENMGRPKYSGRVVYQEWVFEVTQLHE